MSVYIVLYILILLCMALEHFFQFGKKVSAFLITSFTLCIVGFRSENMGYDIPGYLYSFNFLSRIPFSEALAIGHYRNYEKGYILFNSLFGYFSTNEHVFLFFCALLSFLPVAYFAYKNSRKFALSIVIYLALPPFLLLYSGLRQSLAIGLCLLSFEFVKKRNPYFFSLIVAVAATFHTSAILFFIVYPLYRLKIDLKGRIISVVCLLMVYIIKTPLFLILGKILKASPKIDNNGAVTLMIFFILIYIFCFLFSKQTEKENGMLNIFWLACLCQMFGSLNSIAIRVGYYFMLFLIPLLPAVLNDIENKYERISLKMIVLECFILAGCFFIYNGSWAQSYPHYWFWE